MTLGFGLIELLDERRDKVSSAAREMKIGRAANPDFVPSDESYAAVHDAIMMYDLIIIDLSRFAFVVYGK